MRAKNRILARNRSSGKLNKVSIVEIDWEGGGARGHKLSAGRERMSRDWQTVNVEDRTTIGFLMGIGRFGHMAMK